MHMLTALRLKNWKSHHDSTLTFFPGVNAIVGINGAGKSSVLQAIAFALFGTFPQLQRKALTLEDLVTRKPVQRDRASVELDFTVGGKPYTVSRSIAKKSKKFVTAEAELREDSQLKEANPEAVTRLVESLLKIDYDLFIKAVYADQNNLDSFLRLPRGTRMKEIDGMLQLERYERARTGAVSMGNTLRKQAEEKSRLLAGLDEAGLEQQKTEAEAAAIALENQQAALAQTLGTLSQQKEAVVQTVRQLEAAAVRLAAAVAAVARAETLVQELVRQQAEAREKAGGKSEQDITVALAEKEQEINRLNEKIRSLEQSIESSREQLAAANAAVAALRDSLHQLDMTGAVCPVCDSPLPQEKKQALHTARQNAASAAVAAAAARAEEIARKKQERDALLVARQAAEEDQAHSRFLLSLVQQPPARLVRAEEELAAARASRELALQQADDQALQQARQQLLLLAQEAGARESERRSLEQQVMEKTTQRSRLEKQLSFIRTEKQQAARQTSAATRLFVFAQVLAGTQEALRSSFLSTINTNLAAIWPVLYPYGDFAVLQLVIEDGDYALQLREGSRWVSVEQISGGERSAAALALRIAFARAFLPHLRWLMLDEPTHNLDASAVSRFSSILANRVPFLADQLFLVTHEDRLAAGLPALRLTRNKAGDGPTVVSAE